MTKNMEIYKPGEELVFTKSLGGVCQIETGDRAVYLGNSQARITTGQGKDRLVWLVIDSPISRIEEG